MEQLTEFVSKSFTLERAQATAVQSVTSVPMSPPATATAVLGGRSQSNKSLNFTAQNLATPSFRERTPPVATSFPVESSRRRSSSDAELDKEDDDGSRESSGNVSCVCPRVFRSLLCYDI